MFELSFNHIMKYMGTHLLFKEMNFQVFSGERVGIVGENGCGKSTILKLIAGIEPLNIYIGSWSVGYDYGWIYKPKEATVSYLDQIPKYPSHYLVKDVLMASFEELLKLESELRSLENEMSHLENEALEKALKRYGDITLAFEAKGGYDIEEKYNKICTGLNFHTTFLERPFNQLSGGEQTTVVLGKILLEKPDILLLDEPTNHLDTSAIEWLEEYLSSYQGILIVVSHDRYFLDKVVNKIVEIEDLQAQMFVGNYSEYVVQKEEQVRIQYENYLEQKKQIQQMENQVKQLRDWAIKADNNKFFRRAASLKIKLSKIDRIKRPVLDKPQMRLDLSQTSRTGDETIVIKNVSKAYENKKLFENAEAIVHYGERIALVGPNGSGKSTLIKMLLGKESITEGTMKIAPSAKVAYLPQTIVFEDETCEVIDCFRDGLDISEGKAREYLAKFMFYGKRVFTDVKALSGGERVRLKLAKLLYEDVNVLILDEPTNHLDIDSIETLEEALEAFTGTLFFISHDRYFINKIASNILSVEDLTLKRYDGDYDVFKTSKALQVPETLTVESVKKEKVKRESKITKIREPHAKSEKLEIEIDHLERALSDIEQAMADNALDYEKLNQMQMQKDEIQGCLDERLEQWILLET